MRKRVGMDPERVFAVHSRILSHIDLLSLTVDRVAVAARASLNPLSHGIQPGGLIIAPWSIAGNQYASALVQQASSDAQVLASRLVGEAIEQLLASASHDSVAFRDRTFVSGLLQLALAYPETLTRMTPAQRQAWWKTLSDAERSQLLRAHPRIIGNVEGLPYADRDAANRMAVSMMLADPTISAGDRNALVEIQRALDEASKRQEVAQLLLLDFPDGADPRGAISYGDLDTSDYVGVLVPGMDNTVANGMVNLSTGAYNLYREQQQVLRFQGSDETVAVIAWMGYQTSGAVPNLSVLGERRAQEGSPHLVSALDGLHVTLGHDPRVTVFAHSYGSRTATYALSEGGSADAVVLFGSPGIAEPVTTVADLNVPAGEVWVSRAQKDGIAPLGLFGSGDLDAMGPTFGAEHFSSDGSSGREDVDDHGLLLSQDSNGASQGYLDPGTDSLHNMALIGLGQVEKVT